MIVRIDFSTKMPTLYSYYITQFNASTLELLKSNKPFTSYDRTTQLYECTKEVYDKIVKSGEPVAQIEDVRHYTYVPTFQRTHEEEYGYQQDAIDFAMKVNSQFINFGQGMGKSFTTMKIIKARQFRKTLIICGQGNLQEEWIKDAKKHNMKEALNFNIIGDDPGQTTPKKIAWIELHSQEGGVDLINIEALRNQDIVKSLNKVGYDCIVVDEVQSAKGWKSEQTQGLHELEGNRNQMRIALSGTPVLNDPLEFFSLLKFLRVLKDTARTTFEKYYGVWTFDYWGHYVCTGYKNIADLKELLSPVLCYVPKKELGLVKRRQKIDLDWQPSERYTYLEKVYKMSTARLKKQGFTSKPQVRAEMIYINAIAPAKLDFVSKINDKLLLFSQYTRVLDYYKEQLEAQGKKVLYYHGKLNMQQRLDVLEKWRNGEADILLLSIMTARYGLNLTEAHITAFVDAPTSLAILEQAEDRACRIGQTQTVYSYLLCTGKIDNEDYERMANKQAALDELVD